MASADVANSGITFFFQSQPEVLARKRGNVENTQDKAETESGLKGRSGSP